jgi:hypothetical protein
MRYQSRARIGELPVLAIAFGPDLEAQQARGYAVGVVAIGDMAVGIIAIGGLAVGVRVRRHVCRNHMPGRAGIGGSCPRWLGHRRRSFRRAGGGLPLIGRPGYWGPPARRLGHSMALV